jgi:ribonuclease VapC
MVVDTSVLVAIFRDEAEAPAFVDLIDGAAIGLISTITVVETMSVLCGRRLGATREQVNNLVRKLTLDREPFDERQHELAIDALLTFGRGRHPAQLNFGDCFSYALAKSRDLPLLFKGDGFSQTDIVPAWQP